MEFVEGDLCSTGPLFSMNSVSSCILWGHLCCMSRGCEAPLNPLQSLCILLWDTCTEYSCCKKCHCKLRQIFPDGPVSHNRTTCRDM